ncbi:MAG TPA: cache domain-containing protein, partial [Candidatus Ozemobacteraceae bacterium]|nr:cache domain-containing protein [Candidatus Ozemobacteraceae bacterium]
MKIKSQIHLLIFVVLIISMMIPMGTTLYLLYRQASSESSRFRTAEIEQARNELCDLVDLVWADIQDSYQDVTRRENLETRVGKTLKVMVSFLEQVLNSKMAQVKKGERTLENAREYTLGELRSIRLANGGYFWLQDTTQPFPRMVMHPLRPDLEGQILSSTTFNVARHKGDNLFVAAAEEANKPEGGFVDYLWEKSLPDGTQLKNLPKFSYVRALPDWNWVIGIGIFLDEIIEQAAEDIKSELRHLRYNNGNGSFWVTDLKGTVLVHSDAQLIGRNLGQDNALPYVRLAMAQIADHKPAGALEFETTSQTQNANSSFISYYRVFPPLGWIIGSNRNVDFIARNAAQQERQVWQNMWVLIGLMSILFITLLGIPLRVTSHVLGELGLVDPETPETSITITRRCTSTWVAA